MKSQREIRAGKTLEGKESPMWLLFQSGSLLETQRRREGRFDESKDNRSHGITKLYLKILLEVILLHLNSKGPKLI